VAAPPVYALLYRSLAAGRLSLADLDTLAAESALANARRDVTGLLLYAEPQFGAATTPGLFVQWVEGPEVGVRTLFASIRRDSRHSAVEVVAEGPAADLTGRPDRLFPGWSMGHERVGDVPVRLDRFLAYRRALLAGRAA
jgi:hypothetical protein